MHISEAKRRAPVYSRVQRRVREISNEVKNVVAREIKVMQRQIAHRNTNAMICWQGLINQLARPKRQSISDEKVWFRDFCS